MISQSERNKQDEIRADLLIALDYLIETASIGIELLNRKLFKPEFCDQKYKGFTNSNLRILTLKLLKLANYENSGTK